jgi:type IV pilus assembly protein PilM
LGGREQKGRALIKLSRNLLCLEWDARTLRMVVARTGGGQMVLEDAHAHRLPAGVDAEKPQALGEFIAQMLRKHHWHHKRAIVDIPREKAVINRLTLPPTPAHEVAAAVRFQAMKELPFPRDSAVLDYVVMRRDERGLATEVLLAAVPMEALDAVRATCEAAGLEPARVGLRPYSNLVSVGNLLGLGEQRVLFVDVGPTMTEIDVMVRGQLAFARSANVNVPLLGAADEEIGDEPPAAPAEAPAAVTPETIEAAVREVTVEMTRTLQAYRATDAELIVDRVVVAGGTGIEGALLADSGPRFGVPGVLFDPTTALRVSLEEAGKLRSFSATLGLAWGVSREGLLAIDFLNPKKPVLPGAALRRRIRIGAMAVGAVLVAAVILDVTLYLRKVTEYRREQSQIADLRSKLVKYLEVENTVEAVEDWQTDAIWPEHLLRLTQAAVEPGKNMLVQQMSLDARQAKINLKKVLATGWEVPRDFVTRLNEATDDEGRPLYMAKQGSLRTLSVKDAKFDQAVDVEVELLGLKKYLEQRDDREKARKKKLKAY